jgi:hypothetical protein
VEHGKDGYEVRVAWYDAGGEEVIEATFELSEAFEFAPMRYRRIALRFGERGVAHEVQWSDFVALGDKGPWLPRSWTEWEFEYAVVTEDPLVQTEQFTCVELRPTGEGEGRPELPMCAAYDRAASEGELGPEAERLYGGKLNRALGDFYTVEPPPPPEDLLSLDPAGMSEEIKQRYGF